MLYIESTNNSGTYTLTIVTHVIYKNAYNASRIYTATV